MVIIIDGKTGSKLQQGKTGALCSVELVSQKYIKSIHHQTKSSCNQQTKNGGLKFHESLLELLDIFEISFSYENISVHRALLIQNSSD